jgi:two-component system, cell cycle sensor histidine kinase and response regulator CckA
MPDQREQPKSILGPLAAVPEPSDPADAISASLVAGTVDVLLVSAVLFGLLAALAGRLHAIYAWTLPLGLLLLLSVRWILRRGHVRVAAYGLCGLGWLVVAADLPVHGPNTIALGGFLILIVVGGLTLGLRGAVVLTAATAALLAPYLLGAVHGNFEAPTTRDRLLHYATQLALAGTLAGWWATRTRQLLAKLRRSEARFALLLDASPEAISATDLTGKVTFRNRAAQEMVGYAPGEVVNQTWTELASLQDEDLARLRANLQDVITRGAVGPLLEIKLRHRDGHNLTVELRSVPLLEEGKIVGALSLYRDVSAAKAAEAERASLQKQLINAQRMEAVGLIAGGVAHDFNNLLMVIMSAAETSDARARDDIREAARRGVSLTRQLLAFSGRKQADPRPTDINAAIEALRPMLARVLGEDVVLDLRLAPQRAVVVIDVGQLDQVIVNLAVNARDAMPKGGTLTVSTEVRGDRVDMRVADSGCGMDAATLASAFEPFFTTKGSRGTGLGLAVVQTVVRAVQGTVVCASEPGQGTRFVLSFPASSDAPLDPPAEAADSARRSRRVVFVDDNALVRGSLARVLESGGFAVDAFEDGQDVEAIEARLAGADALITDLVMPGRSGVDLALELRRRNCRVPILFVSGYAEAALLERIREVGRSSLLEKPFTLRDLLLRLGELQEP